MESNSPLWLLVRVRHLKMDSRGTAVKSGHECLRIRLSVVKWTLRLPPSSFRGSGTLRIRRDCRKFCDKSPRPRSRRPVKNPPAVISPGVLLNRPLMWVLMLRIGIYGAILCADDDDGARIFVLVPRCIIQSTTCKLCRAQKFMRVSFSY